jgi:hypothetical protein
LAQDASGYRIKRGKLHNSKSPITSVAPSSQDAERPGYIAGPFDVGSDCPGKESRLSDGTRDIYLINSADNTIDAIDWRTHIINYLHNPSVRADKNVRRTTFKYILIDNELYSQTIGDVWLKCLGPDDAILAMAEVNKKNLWYSSIGSEDEVVVEKIMLLLT